MLHCHHAGRLTTIHVPGTDNVMADIASRPTKAQKLFHSPTALSDSAFCSAFDTAFPLPYDQPWMLASTPPWVKFNVFETLRGKQLALPLWTGPTGAAIGKFGQCTAPYTTHSWLQVQRTQTPTGFSHLLLPCGKDSTGTELLSQFSWLKGLSGTSPKGSFWTDIPAPEKPLLPNNPLISLSHDC
jgi:hypothetical protein